MSDHPPLADSLETPRQRFKAAWEKSALGTIEKRARVCEWALHNVVLGFAGVWLPFLAVAFFGYLRWRESILDGDLAMFAVTASAVSLGFFVKESQGDLRKTEMFTYAGLMITMIVGIMTRTALVLSNQFPSTPALKFELVAPVTCVLVLCAVCLNFRLFTLELKSVDRNEVVQRLNAPAVELSKQAANLTKEDGINL